MLKIFLINLVKFNEDWLKKKKQNNSYSKTKVILESASYFVIVHSTVTSYTWPP